MENDEGEKRHFFFVNGVYILLQVLTWVHSEIHEFLKIYLNIYWKKYPYKTILNRCIELELVLDISSGEGEKKEQREI